MSASIRRRDSVSIAIGIANVTFSEEDTMRGPGALAMEYLVTMTTHVPEGTPGQAVDDIRTREAAHTRELAARGHLLRLWRPPLQPGEWRTLGLFAAADGEQLEEALASMPLRAWRTDEVTPLSPHPNDPKNPALTAAKEANGFTEFLTTFTISVPEGTPRSAVENTEAREAQRARELAGQGHLLRLWILPGESRALGLWRARDPAEMQAILKSLPVDAWMTVETTPLTEHPSDPALTPDDRKDGEGSHHHRRLPGHRRRPGRRVAPAAPDGGGYRPDDQAVRRP